MEEEKFLKTGDEESPEEEQGQEEEQVKETPKSAGGWGWGFLSDLQKAAEEISRNAAAVAEKAAKSIADMQEADEGSESASKEEETEESATEKESDDEKKKKRKSALDKLEKASEDSFLSQGLKVFDNSVENFASGAWQALGSAWKEGTNLVQKLENSVQQGGLPVAAGSVAPSLLETGKAFTAKGMQVLEYVGKETMDLLITETGIEIEKNMEGLESLADGDQLYEEVTFDRCFYIYGGPEQLEELEALSSHYALLFNRRKAKLSSDQKSLFDGKLKQIQKIFTLTEELDGNNAESDKGKKIETETEASDDEMKNLHDSSVSKAADMAAGFAKALAGLNVNDMNQRTAGRLESLHSEGVHRLSEMCCFTVSHLLTLGKSIISHANKVEDEATEDLKIEWPEEPIEKAKIVRSKAQLMMGYVEAVSNSFITGVSDVAEAYLATVKGVAADSHENLSKTSSVQDKASASTEHLRSDLVTAMAKIQDGLHYLSYVLTSISMPSA